MRRIEESLSVKTINLKNCLVMPPMATYIADEEGKVTEELLAHYEARIKSGHIGLGITEHAYISAQGRANKKMLSIASDEVLPGLKKLTDLFHRYDTPVIAQFNHAGSATTREISGEEVVSASACLQPSISKVPAQEMPRALTEEELKRLVQTYVEASVRAKEAGYDGVEIHSAHSYLLNQFYSPLTNHREDGYGGSVENRVRLHCEILQAVRKAVGEDYLIAVRLGASDHCEGGNDIADAVKAAKLLEDAGADLLDISGGMCRFTLEGHDEPGYFAEETKAVKEAVQIPVILTGGIKTLDEADSFLENGTADLIGVGRALLQDADWAKNEFEQ
ncbi:MAG: NADH:flavin oxidoreductase [Lachnospiraceae bacterium]|nr:NADH:flavin oxidoreductase [Lachnospiraceae bacterium]